MRYWAVAFPGELEGTLAQRRLSLAPSGSRFLCAVAVAVLAAGCSSTGNVFGGLSGLSQAQTQGPTKAKQPVLIAMPPITGGSDAYRLEVVRQLNQAATPRNIALVVDTSVPCDYTLRGYILTQRQADGLKLLYVWDLLDRNGNRINRFTGETTPAAVPAGGDDWAVMPASATGEMADKTVSSLVTWSASKPGAGNL